MIRKECPSYPVTIFIAGRDVAAAERICAEYCNDVGFCVRVGMTLYVYTGDGYELGVEIGLINYPRFPLTPEEIWVRAEALAERLHGALKQDSYTIQAPDNTVWFSHRTQTQEPQNERS